VAYKNLSGVAGAIRPFRCREQIIKRALTISHVAFENLGTLGMELERAGVQIDAIDACAADFRTFDPLEADLLIVLGGPIAVYQDDAYPFISDEISFLRRRLVGRRPTLGICLGAQLMAASLGAKVFEGARGKEIGWAPVVTGRDTALYPDFARLLTETTAFLHWHGDTFDLPPGARHLGQTALYANQAFALDNYALGLQFHPEVTADGLERWYVGHASELAGARIDVAQLRKDSRALAPKLECAALRFWRAWLARAIGPFRDL